VPDNVATRNVATYAATAVGTANADRYQEASSTLEYVDERYHAVRRQIARELLVHALDANDMPSGAVLELGAGADSILSSLPDLPRLTCVADASPAALDVLRAKHRALINLDANRPLPFADKSIAAVISTDLIEHLYDPMSLIVEFQRVVRPGGVIVLSTPNLATLQDRFRFLFGRPPRQIDPMHDYLKLHIRQYTVPLLRRMLAQAGFTVTAVRSNYVGIEVRQGRWIESRRLARIAPAIGGSLIVAARLDWSTPARPRKYRVKSVRFFRAP
jgi:2-polyprenyl-3-methyl-5-hydroxy-6-metoxy-1,4-benzoquinol methylase